ncbi:unnamed protein product [Calypogeia fissa]
MRRRVVESRVAQGLNFKLLTNTAVRGSRALLQRVGQQRLSREYLRGYVRDLMRDAIYMKKAEVPDLTLSNLREVRTSNSGLLQCAKFAIWTQ